MVNVSYYGAVSYHLDPAYGATKAGLDKLTFDMAQDFKPYKVAVVSIWPGTKATERAKSVLAKIPGGVKIFESAETPKFSGLAIASLYSDPRLMSKSGSLWSSQPKHPPSFEHTDPLRCTGIHIKALLSTQTQRGRLQTLFVGIDSAG